MKEVFQITKKRTASFILVAALGISVCMFISAVQAGTAAAGGQYLSHEAEALIRKELADGSRNVVQSDPDVEDFEEWRPYSVGSPDRECEI